jgi:hypothetical protein
METDPTRPGLAEPAHRALAAVLDCLVPPSPDQGLPGAGELGLVRYVEEKLGDGVTALLPGLAALDAQARARGAEAFVALDADERIAALEALDRDDPGFVPGLVFHTYAGYYQSAVVLEALGMEGRPPHPKGYTIGPDDPRLLEPVRRRAAKLYREP